MSERVFTVTLPEAASKDIEQRLNSHVAGEALFWQDIILHFDSSERTLDESVSVALLPVPQILWLPLMLIVGDGLTTNETVSGLLLHPDDVPTTINVIV